MGTAVGREQSVGCMERSMVEWVHGRVVQWNCCVVHGKVHGRVGLTVALLCGAGAAWRCCKMSCSTWLRAVDVEGPLGMSRHEQRGYQRQCASLGLSLVSAGHLPYMITYDHPAGHLPMIILPQCRTYCTQLDPRNVHHLSPHVASLTLLTLRCARSPQNGSTTLYVVHAHHRMVAPQLHCTLCMLTTE